MRHLTFTGDQMTLNFATSAAGDIRVEIQDAADGKPISDFQADQCRPLFGDSLDRTVVWMDGSGVRKLAAKPVRLRFVLRDADLYSFRFGDGLSI